MGNFEHFGFFAVYFLFSEKTPWSQHEQTGPPYAQPISIREGPIYGVQDELDQICFILNRFNLDH
jgi:hypothetical protein